MKILITTDLYCVKTNGVVTSVRTLVKELKGAGHEVRILTFSDTSEAFAKQGVYYLPSYSLEKVYPGVRMPKRYTHPYVEELINWKPDIIHSQCEFFSLQFAKQIARRTKAPIIHTYHALYEQYVPYLLSNRRLGEALVRWFTRQRLKSVQQIIAPTRKVEAALRQYGVTQPISIIPTGIDLKNYEAQLSADERTKLRASLGIREDQFVVLNLGRLGYEKNVDELLLLFAYSHTEQDNLIFLIVGDGPARKDLEQTSRNLGIGDCVIFAGAVAPEEVRGYYQIADVFVSASTSETQGLTYIEAAANALPLLCRRDPCLDDVLINGKNGFTYTGTDDYCSALTEMLTHTADCKTMGEESRQIAQKFSSNHFGTAVSELYEAVLLQAALPQ